MAQCCAVINRIDWGHNAINAVFECCLFRQRVPFLMLETNPQQQSLKDLRARVEVLRGYL